MKGPNGYILYEGPSLLDGAPIVVIATGYAKGSRNEKTGNMIQTFIMRQDVPPHEALKSGADSSVCGDCPLRPSLAGKGKPRCYVRVFQGPLAVWKAYKRGVYPQASWLSLLRLNKGRVVRLGSYGDPMAAPLGLWMNYTSTAKSWTGYTHQWSTLEAGPERDMWQELVMASADDMERRVAAASLGWRTFRVREWDDKLAADEIVCPASFEAGQRTTCEACKLCQGTASNSWKSIVIADHGLGSEANRLKVRATKAHRAKVAA